MGAILYLSKVGYGGWITFCAHLHLTTGWPIYKLSKRCETRQRSFGYGCSYKNISKLPKAPIVVAAVGKHFYSQLETLPVGTVIVIHDPTELRSQIVREQLDRFRVIVIRESMLRHVPGAEYLPHPFYSYPIEKSDAPYKAVSISRIDYDKHTDIIVKANAQGAQIDVWGFANRQYVFFKLKEMEFEKYYKGIFKKTFGALGEALKDARVVVDMSQIKNDGGGSQYSFLEAIHHGCALILHRNWVEVPNSIWKDGVNCTAVSTPEELVDAVNRPNLPLATNLLLPHTTVNWSESLFPLP